ncbi:transcriptional regulator, HxlR family [Microbispora rosea]|uniref:Transcriptional regulator, HxlR family n=1 Tax=Microbispora rosea TaxID=58117 RepID=A0A1N7C872_9ACTN|nr:helix-turn-helix domain-containing protein [Microbispora rosea]GIH48456.1 HxlR family transcriptional regulator [Microbispora rosea subsp. rosea]SIR59809.1 transcriptional regulator, HxlR family [Microbispora rosea]
MRQTSFADMHCSLARALEVVGDWWTPLILRDVYLGIDRFSELAEDLGLSRNLLTERLNGLIENGILRRERYQERPPRDRYALTEAGQQVIPILVALTAWGDRWRTPEGGPPIRFQHGDHHAAPMVACGTCGDRITSQDLSAKPGPGGRRAPGTMLIAERLGTI